MPKVSVVIPAHNEAGKVAETICAVRRAFDRAEQPYEVIVVDDGSTDGTALEAAKAGAKVVRHPRNIGYGNSIRTGVRCARHPWIALTDADGTYPVEELPSMAEETERRGLDMLVGARRGKYYRGGVCKRWARVFFKLLGEFTAGESIPDINSGLRVIRRSVIEEFWNILCGGFSFTTTLTMVSILTSHFVDYRPIDYHPRTGRSKVRYFRDTLRAGQILIMAILLFNPIKLFILLGAGVALAALPAIAATLLLPRFAGAVALTSFFFVAACLIIALGFLAEQRRASVTHESRDPGMARSEPAMDREELRESRSLVGARD